MKFRARKEHERRLQSTFFRNGKDRMPKSPGNRRPTLAHGRAGQAISSSSFCTFFPSRRDISRRILGLWSCSLGGASWTGPFENPASRSPTLGARCRSQRAYRLTLHPCTRFLPGHTSKSKCNFENKLADNNDYQHKKGITKE